MENGSMKVIETQDRGTSPQPPDEVNKNWDTRTHVVYEIVETERSYVESLQTLVNMPSFQITPTKMNLHKLKIPLYQHLIRNKWIILLVIIWVAVIGDLHRIVSYGATLTHGHSAFI
ncbi:hypothetical protein HNY73_005528 [Argiope bruennichi]|uniref:DH domain-containing protein n=1 Tax=Argiope bruennichi TaxID=94029 RepID=A0A8T0FJW0_ARGBR|nr:hypothetical protein HNY73_005528 [Argiope bruennichi]